MPAPAPARPPAARRGATSRRATLLLAAALAGPATLGVAGLGACYGRGRAAVPQEETTLRVRNQSFLDYNVYVLQGGSRSRLGTVPGNSTRVLRIPPTFVQPGVLLRFQADPIGSNVAPVSDQVLVSPGDEVQLIIPPR